MARRGGEKVEIALSFRPPVCSTNDEYPLMTLLLERKNLVTRAQTSLPQILKSADVLIAVNGLHVSLMFLMMDSPFRGGLFVHDALYGGREVEQALTSGEEHRDTTHQEWGVLGAVTKIERRTSHPTCLPLTCSKRGASVATRRPERAAE